MNGLNILPKKIINLSIGNPMIWWKGDQWKKNVLITESIDDQRVELNCAFNYVELVESSLHLYLVHFSIRMLNVTHRNWKGHMEL